MRGRFALVLLALSSAVLAQDAALDKRVQSLAHELRCLVCQNQTIADSNAPLAVDLRNQIREQLAAGKSERDIIDFMVQRYGDFVLYRPPLNAITLMLWFGPPLILVMCLWAFLRFIRRRRREAPARLSEAERAEARLLLGEPAEGERR